MPIKATDRAALADLMKNIKPEPIKGSCGHALDLSGVAYHISGKPVCQDCYFDRLGALVEQHPAGRPKPSGRG